MHDHHYAYRPDIDGLRAIAILAVIIYHAFPQALPGGFIGVDIFFVISGFLITSILQREIADGSYSISQFYARRIKRLLPALLLVLSVTLVIGWSVLLRDEFQQLGKHTALGAGFVSNITLWLESGYFDRESELKPLLHLWSLGIEEQFYLIWPLIIALVIRTQFSLTAVAAGLGLISFIANLWLITRDPASTFFLPLTRFWELMLGGVLAVLLFTASRRTAVFVPPYVGRYLREVGAFTGLVFIAAALAIINETRPFPGWWALLPTTGAALLIASGPATWIARYILALRPAVFIGLISYPLYLWHWPLFSLARIVNGAPLALELRLLIISVVIGCATATYWYVESPLRIAARYPDGARKVVTVLSALLIAIVISGLLVWHGIASERLTALSAVLSEARADWEYLGKQQLRIAGTVPETVVFIGDSYIQQLYPRIKRLTALSRTHRSVLFSTHVACAPVPGISRTSDPHCATATERGFEIARGQDVVAVVVGGSWVGMIERGDYFWLDDPAQRVLDLHDPQVLDSVLFALEQTLLELVSRHRHVHIVLAPPGGDSAEPGAVAGARLQPDGPPPQKTIAMTDHLHRTGDINRRLRALAERVGAHVIDPAKWICNDTVCFVTDQMGIPRFNDATHLRASFVRCCIKDFDQFILF